MNETVYNFGRDNVLCGTYTTPSKTTTHNYQPCFILLNAGLINQAGPFRLHVELARKLTTQGFHTLRFDLSGIGDSKKHRDNRPHNEQIAGDISDALDFVTQTTGIKKFVLMGICTGADNTHKMAVVDPRIIGTIIIDGYVYKTLGYYLRRLAPSILNPIKAFQWLKKSLTPSSLAKSYHDFSSTLEQKFTKEKETYYWDLPPKQAFLDDLNTLIHRNVNQLYIVTNNWLWSFNHQSQFQEMYKPVDFKGLATSLYFDKTDHLYTLPSDRNDLITTICDWAQKTYQ